MFIKIKERILFSICDLVHIIIFLLNFLFALFYKLFLYLTDTLIYRTPIPNWGTIAPTRQKFIYNSVQNGPLVHRTDTNSKLVHTKILDSNSIENVVHSTNLVFSKSDLTKLYYDNNQLQKSVSTIPNSNFRTPSETTKIVNESSNNLTKPQYGVTDSNHLIGTNPTDEVDKLSLEMYKKVTSFDDTVHNALGTYKKSFQKLSPFGKPSSSHSFVREKNFDNILLLLFKSGYCTYADTCNLCAVHPLYGHLYVTISRSISIDFTTLFFKDPEWESQTEIPFSKKMKLLACAIYLDFNIPYLIRYLGGQYTGDDRDVCTIIDNITGIVPDETVSQMKRILTVGSPTEFHGESSLDNFLEYWRYGNHQSSPKTEQKLRK